MNRQVNPESEDPVSTPDNHSAPAPGQTARDTAASEHAAFGNWFGSVGLDDQGRFDQDDMEFAFAAGMQEQREQDAAKEPQPVPAPEDNDPFGVPVVRSGKRDVRVIAAQPAPVDDINELTRKVQQTWDAVFTHAASSAIDYQMARVAVETVLGAIAARVDALRDDFDARLKTAAESYAQAAADRDQLRNQLAIARDALTEFSNGGHGDIASLDAQQALDRIASLEARTS